ncbi:hypothetical protein [Pseudocowpox virus]|uniref:Uncharacterized protein n=1 Tax=Pseudocowpox virus TaxID=129726 RepID=D3IZS0_9POXV|nr:hypothetical protein PCPV_gp125 [Pseudocowpox virus]ADC54024.1 hypothetical protein [Pseudocowpox virus]
MDPAGQRLRGPGPWRLNPPTAAALEGAVLRPAAAAGAHRCVNATVDSRHMGVGEGREVPADIEGLMTEIHLRFGMTRVLRNVHFVQFWHGEHVRRRPARHVFTVWVCLSGEVRIYAECCQAGHGFVLCRQMAAGYMFVTEPTDSVTISVPHRMRNSRSPVWLAAVFATRHFEPLPPPMYAVPGHVVLARSASMLCDCWPSDPQRRNVVFYLRLSGSMVRVTVPGAELEIECTSGFAPDHFSIDDECVCCQARPHVARTAVWPLAEICRGATVVLAPPLARDRAAGLLAEIRLASQRWVRVRAIRSGRGDMGPLPSVVWAATFSAIRLFMEGTVPAFAACVENGRAAYGMVYVPPEEPRMDGLCVFPTPAEPAALFVRGEEVIAAGAAAAMIAAAERAANGEAAGGAGARGSPAAAGEAASEAMETAGGGAAADDDMEAEAHDFEIEFDQDPGAPAGAARADSDSDEDDESSGPESGDERARSEDDSDSSDSYSAFSSSDEDDSDDADDSWGDSDSGIEEDDDGVGQAIEEEEEEERQVLGAVAEMLGD